MKRKEKTSLSAMTRKELDKVLIDAKTAYAIGVMNRYTKQMKNAHELTSLRRKIAFVSTLIHQKEQAHE